MLAYLDRHAGPAKNRTIIMDAGISTEENLAHLKQIFAKQDVILNYEDIQRSPKGVITAISVRFLNKKTNNSGMTNQNNPQGINSFKIIYQDDTIGFADVSVNKESGTTPNEVLSQIGKDPL